MKAASPRDEDCFDDDVDGGHDAITAATTTFRRRGRGFTHPPCPPSLLFPARPHPACPIKRPSEN